MSEVLSRVVEWSASSPWIVLLAKLTAILAVAWLAHAALALQNPRWRVLVWRAAVVALCVAPVLELAAPKINVYVAKPAARPAGAHTATTAAPPPIEALSDRAASPISDPSIDRAAGRAADRNLDAQPSAAGPAATAARSASIASAAPIAARRAIARWTALQALLSIWVAVAALLAARLIVGIRRLSRLIGESVPSDQPLGELAKRVADAIGCRGEVALRVSTSVSTPLAYGWRRPVLVLPERMCGQAYRDDLPAILAHELAHIRAADPAWNLIFHVVRAVLWFHPLVWRMPAAHLAACEATSDAVAAAFTNDVRGYSRTLSRVAAEANLVSAAAAGVAMARMSDVRRRLVALRRRVFHASLPAMPSRLLVAGALAAAVMLCAVQLVSRQPVAQAQEPAARAAREAADSPIRVRVVDPDAQPIAGARVVIKRFDLESPVSETTTDDQGVVMVEVGQPLPRILEVAVTPPGFVPMGVQWEPRDEVALPREFTFTLERGTTIGGRVVDERGAPIEGASVRTMVSASFTDDIYPYFWDVSSTTDATGRWTCDVAPADPGASLYANASHPDFTAYRDTPRPTPAQYRDQTAVLVLHDGVAIEGIVVDSDGQAVRDALVVARSEAQRQLPNVTAKTDAMGRFRIEHLVPGRGAVGAIAPGLAPNIVLREFEPGAPEIKLVLDAGRSVRLQVVDQNGMGLAGVSVTPNQWRGQNYLPWDLMESIRPNVFKTDENGRWDWQNAPRDAISYNFYKEGHARVEGRSLAPRDESHVIVLEAGSFRLSGRVIDDETSEPIKSFRLTPGWSADGRFQWSVIRARQDEEGRYTHYFDRPAQAYGVRIAASGYLPADATIDRDPNSTSAVADVRLRRSQGVHGLVRLPSGKPAVGAVAMLSTGSGFVSLDRWERSNPDGEYQTTTDAEGRFHLKAGSENANALTIAHQEGYAVVAASTDAEQAIKLVPWGRVEGVLWNGSRAADGETVRFEYQSAEGVLPRVWLNNRQMTDTNGRFVFEHVPIGIATVGRVIETGARSYTVSNEQTVLVEPGKTTRVMVGGRGRPIVGKVVFADMPASGPWKAGVRLFRERPRAPYPDGSDGWPADLRRAWYENWRKSWDQTDEGLAYANASKYYAARTLPDGSFRIDDVEAGNYRLLIRIDPIDAGFGEADRRLAEHNQSLVVEEIPGGQSDEPLNVGEIVVQPGVRRPPAIGQAPDPRVPRLVIHVLDSANKPAAGAEVTPALFPDFKRTTLTTDPEGKVSIDVPSPDEPASIIVRYPRHVSMAVIFNPKNDGASIPGEFTFRLEAGTTIGGVIHNEAGEPIAGATVAVLAGNRTPGLPRVATPSTFDESTTSGPDGRWTFDRLSSNPANVRIRLTHPDYISDSSFGDSQRPSIEQLRTMNHVMVMKRGVALEGTVVDAAGKPLPNAVVAPGSERFGTSAPAIRTDGDGRFRFANLAPGEVILTVAAKDLAPQIERLATASLASPVEIKLASGHAIRVRVQDTEGRPIEGAWVAPDTWRGYRTLTVFNEYDDLGVRRETDAQGDWSWSSAPEDAIEYDILKQGYVPLRRQSMTPRAEPYVVTLRRALTISGRVVDAETREPIGEFRVVQGMHYERLDEPPRWMYDRRHVGRGVDGRYEVTFDDAAKGYAVRIEADRYLPAESPQFVDAGGTFDAALRRGAPITGTVALPDGAPAAMAEVVLVPSSLGGVTVRNGSANTGVTSPPSVVADAEGRFSFDPLAEPFALLALHDRGFAFVGQETLRETPTIRLTPWARIEGRVVRGTEPLPGAKVTYQSQTEPRIGAIGASFSNEATADQRGNFAIDRVLPGWGTATLRNSLSRAGMMGLSSITQTTPIDVTAGETTSVTIGGRGRPVVGRIVLPQGYTLYGNVEPGRSRLVTGTFLVPMPVGLTDRAEREAWMAEFYASDQGKALRRGLREYGLAFARDGSFRADDVPEGTYELEISVQSGSPSIARFSRTAPSHTGRLARTVTVSPIPGGRTDEPLDLGDLDIQIQAPADAGARAPRAPLPKAK